MDFQPAQTPPPSPPWGRAAAGAAGVALALYGWLLIGNTEAVAGGSDSSGYMNHARLIASGHLHVQPRTLPGLPQAAAAPFLYVPLGFKPAGNGDGLVPTYPVGFALFVLALEPFAGWRHAGDAVIVLHSLAGLVATFGLGRLLGLSRAWAALAAGIIAASPLYLSMSIQAMSDVPSLVWTTLAVLAALKSRERAPWALAAGAAVALDILLRPTNVLAFAPLAVALGTNPRRWMLFLAGGLPGAVFFCAHSLAAYGSLAATGYGDNSRAFAAGYIAETLVHYGRWLPALFTPLVFLNLGLPWVSGQGGRTRWILGVWILAYAGFYCVYQNTHETWWYLRFLLPAAPAMAVGGLITLRSVVSRTVGGPPSGEFPKAFACAVLALAACSAAADHHLHPLETSATEQRYPLLTDWMQKHLPGDAVCLSMQASGAIFYYTDFTLVRWDFVDPGNVEEIESVIRASKRPLYAVLFPFEYADSHLLDRRMPGQWTEVGSVKDIVIMRRDFASPKS